MEVIIRSVCVICVVLLICDLASAQREKSVLLPQSEAHSLAEQCSRTNPPEFNETWQPTEAAIKDMESKFSRIAECCEEGTRFDDPEDSYMQYVGIIVKGRKLIYINAFPFVGELFKDWKERAVRVCDGGSGFWGVLYDTETGKFFDLAVNGLP
jgi:hypothetical protein